VVEFRGRAVGAQVWPLLCGSSTMWSSESESQGRAGAGRGWSLP
jgi:hypothetical protein